MTFGKQADGTNVIHLTRDETKQLLRGESVAKDSADALGDWVITVTFERPKLGRPYSLPGEKRPDGAERLVQILRGPRVEENKAEWSKLAKAVLKELAAKLGLVARGSDPARHDHEITWNPAGPVLAGSVHLSSHWLYLTISHYYGGIDAIYFRRAGVPRTMTSGKEDRLCFACGDADSTNTHISYDDLLDLDALAERLLACKKEWEADDEPAPVPSGPDRRDGQPEGDAARV